MRICVLGLDCATPELLFGDERLVNLRRLMDFGVYGRLRSVIPPITVPAWMCMATSQDPGSLGVYGFRNRLDYSYDRLGFANSATVKGYTIWDHMATEGRKSILAGVPPNFPPRRVNGISIGCFLTPDPASCEFTHPASLKKDIWDLVGEYPVDVKRFRTADKDWLKREIFGMSRKQWQVVHRLISEHEWDYFQFVDIGLDRIQHGFWEYFDQAHVRYVPGNPYENVISEYYQWLDEQIGIVLERLDNDTIVLVVSDHGAQALDGGFAVNEWLVKEGLLVLDEYPSQPTSFSELKVNWGKTRVWSEGGYYARLFFNVAGREPHGTIPADSYEGFRDEIKARVEALTDDKGVGLGSTVFKPDVIYRRVRNVAPDLIVQFGDLRWRSIGGVGSGRLHMQENDTGPDGCNHSPYGGFILAGAGLPLGGEYEGASILDIAPTLLELAGYDIPESMQGRSMLTGPAVRTDRRSGLEAGGQIIEDRLAGLGYI